MIEAASYVFRSFIFNGNILSHFLLIINDNKKYLSIPISSALSAEYIFTFTHYVNNMSL
jgi:hypothetical protein